MYRTHHASFAVRKGVGIVRTVIQTIGSVHKGIDDHRPVTEILTMVTGSAPVPVSLNAGKYAIDITMSRFAPVEVAYVAMFS